MVALCTLSYYSHLSFCICVWIPNWRGRYKNICTLTIGFIKCEHVLQQAESSDEKQTKKHSKLKQLCSIGNQNKNRITDRILPGIIFILVQLVILLDRSVKEIEITTLSEWPNLV